jgi:hypothetical protein
MNDNQFTPETGNQQNQPLKEKLSDNQNQSENNQGEDSENGDRNTRKDFPERTQQHDYKNPTADQTENEEEDDVDTDGQIFVNNDDADADPVDEQSTDLRDTDHI